jgi:hypothetical protein
MSCLCRGWLDAETAAERDWRKDEARNKVVPADDEAGAVGAGGASQQPRAEGQPSVLVIGWFRCKARHLRKYGQVYAAPEIGFHPLLFDRHSKVTPLQAGALFCGDVVQQWSRTYGERAEQALALVRENDVRVVHILSMGGCAFWAAVLAAAAARGDGSLDSVRGVVLDSCPGYTSMGGASGGALFHFAMANVRGAFARALVIVLYVPLWVLATLLQLLVMNYACCRHSLAATFQRVMLRPHLPAPLRCRYLFLYSDDDKICSSHTAKTLARQLRAQEGGGVATAPAPSPSVVQEHDFAPSKHVQHLRLHPSVYAQKVRELCDAIAADRAPVPKPTQKPAPITAELESFLGDLEIEELGA